MRAVKQDNKVVTVESLKNAKSTGFCTEFWPFWYRNLKTLSVWK